MSKSKKTKTKPQGIKSVAVMEIPEKDLMALVKKGGVAAVIQKLAQEVNKTEPDMAEAMKCGAKMLRTIETIWLDALKEFANATALPPGFVPEGYKPAKKEDSKPPKKTEKKVVKKGNSLSPTEQATVKKLRKEGWSIKKIGKEIHRAEKVVADFVRSLAPQSK